MALFHQLRRADEKSEKRAPVKDTAKLEKAVKILVLAETKKGKGRKADDKAKKLLTLRLDPDVIEHFKSTGKGWQTRLNEALRKAADLPSSP